VETHIGRSVLNFLKTSLIEGIFIKFANNVIFDMLNTEILYNSIFNIEG
jgi:hypothetical protein